MKSFRNLAAAIGLCALLVGFALGSPTEAVSPPPTEICSGTWVYVGGPGTGAFQGWVCMEELPHWELELNLGQEPTFGDTGGHWA